MKATEARFLNFLRGSQQFVIPIYQRTYSWTKRECSQLWDDIKHAGSNEATKSHFMGSVVYIDEGISQISGISQHLVIDGQQRLTTVTLILEALARQLRDNEPINGFSAKKLREYYMLNSLEKGELKFKLLLSKTDKASLFALVQQKAQPREQSLRINENFAYFEKQVKDLGANFSALCHGLAKLTVVDITLERTQDNPQLIFESMNSAGLELNPADLVRNFILMGLDPEHQTRLYEDHWRPMEVDFGQEGDGSGFASFMRHYLTLKTGVIPKIRKVYEAFKAYAKRFDVVNGGVDTLVKDIHDFATYYCSMELGKETDKKLAEAFRDLRELKVNVAYPFLLELYDDYVHERLVGADFEAAVRLVEAYVFRRAMCEIPTNSLNTTFLTFGRALQKDKYLESMKAHLLLLSSYRRFPENEEFKRYLTTRDFDTFSRVRYLLDHLEDHGRKERVPGDAYTIEHILPQNENLSEEWQNDLGSEWQRVREDQLHNLGNLTLTGYNSEYSDRPFLEKRNMEGGFRESPLKLNEGLGKLDQWDELAIKRRAERLATLATSVWEMPSLPADVLESYRPKSEKKTSYTIADYPQFYMGSPMWTLFEALRKDVLALDPCVKEEPRKHYISYRAKNSFVNVVPLKAYFRLFLNMQFHDLYDPEDLARDVANIGHLGSGDVEVGFSKREELPHVMNLVKQAFDKQTKNVETEV